MSKLFLFLIFFLFSMINLSADTAGKHDGAVTALIYDNNTIISAGEDGFIGIWNASRRSVEERFQLTTFNIKAMQKHPLKDEICIIENSGMNVYRISAWNYKTKEKLFSILSRGTVTYINYSAGGNFIITAGLHGENLTLLDSTTGRILLSPDSLSGTAALGITGRAERNILVYQSRHSGSGGLISYLDISTSAETGRFEAPGSLESPIVFGNSRFLAGINIEGLVVADASSGNVLGTNSSIRYGALLFPEENEFVCVNYENGFYVFYRFAIDRNGSIITRRRLELFRNTNIRPATVTAVASGGNTIIGTENGEVFILGQQNQISAMAYNNRPRIIEAAAAQNHIAFLTENGEMGFIPLDYRQLRNGTLRFESKQGYNRITTLHTEQPEDQLILWHDTNTRTIPQLIHVNQNRDFSFINSLTGRFSPRLISSWNNRLLVLDSGGNISVYNSADLTASVLFTHSSVGTIDAAFVNEKYFILCRSVIRDNSPFLMVNYSTGETVPILRPSRAGIMAYTGNIGMIYAAVLEQDSGGIKTTVTRFPAAGPFVPEKIVEYPGEDVHVSFTESAGHFASAGTDGAEIYSNEIIQFERTEGLTVKLLGCDNFFISLDSVGNISWHNNRTGRLHAVFRLYADKWTLTGENNVSGSFIMN